MRLGVDVGTARVGLAACDADGVLAYPVATLSRQPVATDAGEPGRSGITDGPPADIAEIARVASERDVIEIIVGLPRSLDGSEGAAAAGARDYALTLARACSPVPVRLVDERLTTVDAHRALHESGVAGRRHRRVVDQAAAVIILQNALEAERLTGTAPGQPALTVRRKARRRKGTKQ